MNYKEKAIHCVQDTVLPMQLQWFKDSDYDLDIYCKKYGYTDFFYAKQIETGHIYEMGYLRCLCPEALNGTKEDNFCECSRQSMIYILEHMLPEKAIKVEMLGTVLNGDDKCRFRVTVE